MFICPLNIINFVFDKALSRAFEEDLRDQEIILLIGEQYYILGLYKNAEMVIRRLLYHSPCIKTYELLGNALFEQNKLLEAREFFNKVVLNDQYVEDQYQVEDKLVHIGHALGF